MSCPEIYQGIETFTTVETFSTRGRILFQTNFLLSKYFIIQMTRKTIFFFTYDRRHFTDKFSEKGRGEELNYVLKLVCIETI